MTGPGMDSEGYPWYRFVHGTDLGQGDILERCPVFLPPTDLAERPLAEAAFAWQERDVIVMSQTCNLVPGREKVTEVLLCSAWSRSELTSGHLATTPQAWRTLVGATFPVTICSPRVTCRDSPATFGSWTSGVCTHFPWPSSARGQTWPVIVHGCFHPIASISHKPLPGSSCVWAYR